jgi:phosphopantothenoylcysteine decarboxylase/phosphopantothenate--cysteine ligase
MLQGKNILLGVCGSIAAYKAAALVRLLVKAGARVQVVMTPGAEQFITPLTLATLSGNPVLTAYAKTDTGEWNNHVELGIWADALLIAPASANTLAKMATGFCDNLLTAVYLSARCPVFFAPAMDLDMWAHRATQQRVQQLLSYGNHLIPPGTGELASGLTGEGRLAEPEEIITFLHLFFSQDRPLAGKRAMVTAGPTYEAMDPVRFIGNHSSGKMGFAIAARLAQLGAAVTLVSGPSALNTPPGVDRISVTTADDMLQACLKAFPESEIAVMSAAVADYRPASVAPEKIKKNDARLHLELEKTTDILAELGRLKKKGQVLVGFALESENGLANATAKMHRKNLDFIVLNSLRDEGAGFAVDTNKITLIDRRENVQEFPLQSKNAAANDICSRILTYFNN